MKTYSEKLKDPRWQKKRLEVLERDNWTCQDCHTKEETLHVHHLFYIYGKEPWEYDHEDLLTLCVTCHEMETEGINDSTSSAVQSLKRLGFISGDFYDLEISVLTLIDEFKKLGKPRIDAKKLLLTPIEKLVKKVFNLGNKGHKKVKKEEISKRIEKAFKVFKDATKI